MAGSRAGRSGRGRETTGGGGGTEGGGIPIRSVNGHRTTGQESHQGVGQGKMSLTRGYGRRTEPHQNRSSRGPLGTRPKNSTRAADGR